MSSVLPREDVNWGRAPRRVAVDPYKGHRVELVLTLRIKDAITDLTAQETRDLITILQFELVKVGEEL